MELLYELIGQWTPMVGAAALIAVLINILKAPGWIKDGQAPVLSLLFNLVGMGFLYAIKVYKPEIDLAGLDETAADFANVLFVVLTFVIQLGTSKGTHAIVRGGPLGKSFSLK